MFAKVTGPARSAEVTAKLDRVRRWMSSSGHEAVLFAAQPGVAWVTGGLEDKVARNEEPGQVWALVDADSAHLLTTNVEEPRLVAEHDVVSLGFTLQVTPWYRPGGLAELAAEIAGERRLAGDGSGPGEPVADELAALRMPLTAEEQERLSALGADCAGALEEALRLWAPDQTEMSVAARIAAALEERGVLPSVLLVGGYERRRKFRHTIPTDAVTGRDVLAGIVGVRGGLNVGCSRSASAGVPAADLLARHRAACLVEARMIAATRPGHSWESALAAGQSAYAEAGFPGEWRAHWQGGPVGYYSQEFDVVPGSGTAARAIIVGSAFSWNPTVQGAKSEDTFLVGEEGAVPVSNTADWPYLAVDMADCRVQRPAILSV